MGCGQRLTLVEKVERKKKARERAAAQRNAQDARDAEALAYVGDDPQKLAEKRAAEKAAAFRTAMRRQADARRRDRDCRRAAQVAEEEAGLKARRKAQTQAAKREREDLPDSDPIAEQALRPSIVLRATKTAPRRRIRQGVVHDPRFQFVAKQISAAQRLERIHAEAQRLGACANPLAAMIEKAGVRGSGGGDYDDARTRIVGAWRKVQGTLLKVSGLPELKTPGGWRSQRDAIQLCVLDELPVSALALTNGGRRYSAARALLNAALDRLAEVLPEEKFS